jgi:hypothetical protein
VSDDWANFFIAQVGASAALLGLLFVGVSINLDRILALAGLPDRALFALVLIFNVLLVSSLMLVPGQPLRLLGAEVLIGGTAVWVIGTRFQVRSFHGNAHQTRMIALTNLFLFEIAAVPFVIAGVVLILGFPVGFYAIAVGILVSVAKAVGDAWVLLVEINR